MTRLARMFAACRAAGEAALLPYLTLGFPAPGATIALARALLAAGADGLELGIPSAAPTADGPVLRQVAAAARAAGVTVPRALELLATIRTATAAPLVLLVYAAELHAHGPARLCAEAAAAGADALLVPDAPHAERTPLAPTRSEPGGEGPAALLAACAAAGLAWVPLVTLGEPLPAAPAGPAPVGFLYCRLHRGPTGARRHLPRGALAALRALRAQAPAPLVAGFGLSAPEQIARLAASVDGVVVGSALAERVRAAPADPAFAAARAYVGALKAACRSAARTTGARP
jgi:tryptophan synthase alpha chain